MEVVPEYKIILLGEPGVGKTNFFLRLRHGTFAGSAAVSASLGTEYLEYSMTIHEVTVKGILYDTAGGERYRTLTSNYYMNSDAAILMFSVDDNHSFARLRDEVENAARFIHSEKFVWVLLGHKSDLNREVSLESVVTLAGELNTKLYFFASSKTGDNVVEVLESVLVYVHKLQGRHHRPSRSGSHRLTMAANTTNKSPKVTRSQAKSSECSC